MKQLPTASEQGVNVICPARTKLLLARDSGQTQTGKANEISGFTIAINTVVH